MHLNYYTFHFVFTEPSKPEKLIVHENKITKTTINVSWKEPIPLDVSIVGYELEYKKIDEDLKKVTKKSLRPEDLSYKVTGLNAYTRYGFRVAAFNSAGTGPYTDIVTQFTSKYYENIFTVATYMYIHTHIYIRTCLQYCHYTNSRFLYNELTITTRSNVVVIPLFRDSFIIIYLGL